MKKVKVTKRMLMEHIKRIILVENLMVGKQTIAGKQYSTDTSIAGPDLAGTQSLGSTSGPRRTDVEGYVVEDAALFQAVLRAIGTEGSTGFGNCIRLWLWNW